MALRKEILYWVKYFLNTKKIHPTSNYTIKNSTEYDTKHSDIDDLPYTTLLYGNGPGYGIAKQDGVISGKNTIQAAAVPRVWATHGGEDVPVFATGPLANLFSGSFDQTYIPHAIAYIACLDYFKERCGCLYFNCDSSNQIDNNLNDLSMRLNVSCVEGECEDNVVQMINENHVVAQMRLVSYNNATKMYSWKLYVVFCIIGFLINVF